MGMHFDESEKPSRLAAVKHLRSLLRGRSGKRLQALKKPSESEPMGDHEDELGGGMDGDEDDNGACPHCGK